MEQLTQYALTQNALRTLASGDSIPDFWFNWTFVHQGKTISRITLLDSNNPNDFDSWIEGCALLGTNMVFISGGTDMLPNVSEDNESKISNMLMASLSGSSEFELDELRLILRCPEQEIMREYAVLECDFGNIDFKSPSFEFSLKYGKAVREWILLPKNYEIKGFHNFYLAWDEERADLHPSEFTWPEKDVDLSDGIYIPITRFECCGIFLKDDKAVPWGFLPQGRNEQGNWLFDSDGVLERQVLSMVK